MECKHGTDLNPCPWCELDRLSARTILTSYVVMATSALVVLTLLTIALVAQK